MTNQGPGPRVFISATSGDLGSVRQLVKDALLAIDCHPVEQTTFPPDYRSVLEVLEDKIKSCEAVTHIVGCRYGAEPDPARLPPDTPRRSYTQMEYDLARKLGKKLYVFLCPEDFPYDRCDPEPEDKQRLQKIHRKAILADDKLFTEVEEKNQIATKVRELQLELQRLRRRIGRYAAYVGIGLALLLVVLAGIGFGIYQQSHRIKEVSSAIVDPAQLAQWLRKQIEAKAGERLQRLRDQGAGWRAVRQVERQRDAALGQVDELVRFIEAGLAGDADPVFREASRILSREGSDASLAYLDSHRQDLLARVDRLAAQEQSARHQKQQALEPLLLEAQLHEGNLDWDKALASYRTVAVKAPEWSRARWQLGDLLTTLGRYGEAEKHLQAALDHAQDDGAWASTANSLAGLYWLTAKWEKAEPLYRRALAICEKANGPDHPDVATALNNLASLLQDTNRLAEAEPLYRGALAIDEKAYGPDHPKVAIDLNNLAHLLQATNRLAETEPLFRRALAIDEKAYGPDHPKVARDLNNLALLLWATNRLAEAEPLVRRALAIDEKAYGPDHPDVARDLNNLAVLLKSTHRLVEAEPLNRRALAIDKKAYGPDHPKVAIRLNNLAMLLQATNRLAEAEPLFRRVLIIFHEFENKTGHEHPHMEAALRNYRSLLKATGQSAEKVEQHVKQALAVSRPLQPIAPTLAPPPGPQAGQDKGQ